MLSTFWTDNQSWIETVKIALGLLTPLSLIVAVLAYRASLAKINDDRIRERDKEILAQAERSLQWAYDALTDNGVTAPPESNRTKWLTCARHLLRGRKLANMLSSPTYMTVYEEVEEYWRYKFYVALCHKDLRTWIYFADLSEPDWPEGIDIPSALVVVDFSNWKKGLADPMDHVDRDALIKNGSGVKGNAGRGLEGYIVKMTEIKIRNSKIQ